MIHSHKRKSSQDIWQYIRFLLALNTLANNVFEHIAYRYTYRNEYNTCISYYYTYRSENIYNSLAVNISYIYVEHLRSEFGIMDFWQCVFSNSTQRGFDMYLSLRTSFLRTMRDIWLYVRRDFTFMSFVPELLQTPGMALYILSRNPRSLLHVSSLLITNDIIRIVCQHQDVTVFQSMSAEFIWKWRKQIIRWFDITRLSVNHDAYYILFPLFSKKLIQNLRKYMHNDVVKYTLKFV
jgi:hypothetical protein